MRTLIILLVFLIASCANVIEQDNCNPPTGWENVADTANGKILLFGEVHGTTEAPIAFLSYVCAASRRGKTLIALEIIDHDLTIIREAINSEDPERYLVENMTGYLSSPDGRGSEAMLFTLVGLIELVHSGVDIEFAAILPSEDQNQMAGAAVSQRHHEKILADNLTRNSVGYKRTIALIGNVHAAKAPLDEKMAYSPMASLIPSDKIISINIVTDGGTVYALQMNENGYVYPGIYPRNKSSYLDSLIVPEAPSIMLTDQLEPAYDGVLYIGETTASPPANGLDDTDWPPHLQSATDGG